MYKKSLSYPADRVAREPSLKEIDELQALALEVGEGKRDARSVARLAIYAGFMLIGTTSTKDVHHPVEASEHRYTDVKDRQVKSYGHPAEEPRLQAGKNADIAIMCGLFGDVNSNRERLDRYGSIARRSTQCLGWGTDAFKTFRQGLWPGEEAHVRTHALPELINAARNPDNPFTGSIDCVFDDPSFMRVTHEIAQFLTPLDRETILSIPLVGCFDLPPDIIPTNYIPSGRAT